MFKPACSLKATREEFESRKARFISSDEKESLVGWRGTMGKDSSGNDIGTIIWMGYTFDYVYDGAEITVAVQRNEMWSIEGDVKPAFDWLCAD